MTPPRTTRRAEVTTFAVGLLLAFVPAGLLISPASGDVSPTTATLTIDAAGTGAEAKTVNVPAVPPKADIEIAIDTTGSMSATIAQAKAEATNLVNAVKAEVADAQFAIIDFRDSTDGAAEYQVRTTMTADAPTVQAAIDAMSAGGGDDFPEAYNLVFNKAYNPPTGGDIGWRSGSRKFVVVIGDAPPHDAGSSGYPACNYFQSADPHGLNTATELAGLAASQRTLFMVAADNGFFFDIKPCYDQLVAGGFSGSASVRLGSSFADQIVALIQSAASTVADVHLEVDSANPSPASASWVSFSPASPGPVSTPATLNFTVTVAVPAATPPGTYTFAIVALADGGAIGDQTLTIVVPVRNRLAIAAGNQFTCAISEGAVECAGYNGSGQLGDGTTTRRLNPVAVSGITDALSLAGGRDHTCALLGNGTVACWGDNGYGQLGDGTISPRLTPVAVTGLTDVVEIAAGDRHTCARTSAGEVKCWGANSSGQIGDGTKTRRLAPVTVSGVSGATAIAAGDSTSCAVVAGAVKCWGDGGYGQLGNGTANTSSAVPVTVSGLSDATQVDIGSRHVCAVQSSGGVRCWGANLAGALGDGTTLSRTAPVAVAGIGTATRVSLGTDFSCALLGDASVRCWGWNNAGQLGDNTTTNRLTPVAVVGLTDASEISAGTNHVVARREAGPVVAWGNNSQGQFGNGATANSRTPTPSSF